MHQVPNAFLEMLNIHDHLLQALVLMVGTNDIGVATKALNSHLGKTAREVQAVVIPHHVLTAEEKWFSDPHHNPTKLSEPGYDILIQDICLALTTHMQFSSVEQQWHVAILSWTSTKHCKSFTKEVKTRQEDQMGQQAHT